MTEQELQAAEKEMQKAVMLHAAGRELVLWKLLNSLIKNVNDYNQSKEQFKAITLAGRTEAIAIMVNDLLVTSAREVFDDQLAPFFKTQKPHLENVPVFGECNV